MTKQEIVDAYFQGCLKGNHSEVSVMEQIPKMQGKLAWCLICGRIKMADGEGEILRVTKYPEFLDVIKKTQRPNF